MRYHLILVSASLALASCGGEPQNAEPADTGVDSGQTEDVAAATEASSEAAEPVASAEPAKLAMCKACHTFNEGGPNLVGPNLWDSYGKPAASNPDFAYSSALRDAGITWDDDTLHAYLENPRIAVPGGKMAFAGMRNEDDRAEVIAYLATLNSEAAAE